MPGFNINDSGDPTKDPSNVKETLRKHRWGVVALGPIVTTDNELLFAESLQLPDIEFEVKEVKAAFLTYKFASAAIFGDATVTFYDTFGLFSLISSEWFRRIGNITDGIKEHTPNNSGYKIDSSFELLDDAGKCITKLTLKNSWPKRISQGDLSYGSSEIKLLTITLAFDFAEAFNIDGNDNFLDAA